MAFRGDLDALILGALQNEPMHGYDIMRTIRSACEGMRISEGQVYPILHRLEEAGHVIAEWRTDTGSAARREYQLTPKGRKELESRKALWEQFAKGVSGLLQIKGGQNA